MSRSFSYLESMSLSQLYDEDETDTWMDAQNGQTCGLANPMCRGDDLDPYHEP